MAIYWCLCGRSVFTTATALIIYWQLNFLGYAVFMQSSLGIRPVQGAHKLTAGGGYQDVVHVTSVEPF